MGLFGGGSKSTSSTSVVQTDLSQTIGEAQGDSISAYGSNVLQDGSEYFNLMNSIGSSVNIERLDADLAKHTVQATIDSINENYQAALGFTQNNFDKITGMISGSLQATNEQLDEQRKFAQGIVSEISQDSDERFQKITLTSTALLIGAVMFIAWRAF